TAPCELTLHCRAQGKYPFGVLRNEGAMRHLGLEVWCLRKAGLARIALEFRKCSDLNVERKIQALGDDPGGQGDHGVGDREDLFRPAGTKHSLQLGDSD